jgi:anti-anti-sigma factor
VTVEVTAIEGVPVASVDGSLDMTTVGELDAALRSIVPNTAMGLVIDLRSVTHLDSAGLRVLFQTIRRLDRRQQRLRLVVAPESLAADLVEATDVVSYAGVDHDPADAVAHLRSAA